MIGPDLTEARMAAVVSVNSEVSETSLIDTVMAAVSQIWNNWNRLDYDKESHSSLGQLRGAWNWFV